MALGHVEARPASDADLLALGVSGRLEEYEPVVKLWEQGEPADHCFLVASGSIELYRPMEKNRAVALSSAGQFVGDIAVLLGIPYLSSSRTGPVGAVALRLEREPVLSLLVARPALTMGWLMAALTQLAHAHGHLETVLGGNARRRVAGALLDRVDAEGVITISQDRLASLVGLGRQTINKALAELAEEGLVDTRYREISILDPEGLAQIYSGRGRSE